MLYFGDLSCNRYKIGGTRVTKPRVKKWMEALAEVVKANSKGIEPPVLIKLSGKFTDERYPDLANLHKVIGDAIQMGLGINDKCFRFEDGKVETGYLNPELEIEILGSYSSGVKV